MSDREKVLIGLKCLVTEDGICDECPYNERGFCVENIASDALVLLKEQPEIIHCKDCKHADISASGLIKCAGIFRAPDWFCADGKREQE